MTFKLNKTNEINKDDMKLNKGKTVKVKLFQYRLKFNL